MEESVDESSTAVDEEGSSTEDESSGETTENQPRWYVIHTFAGQEQKTADRLMDMADKEGIRDEFVDVVVPTNEVTEIKKGDKKQVEKQLYPGYLFVRMIMSERNWHLARQVDGVTGFVGTQMDPIPLEDTEMSEVMAQIGEDESQLEVEFSEGDTVRIISGAMEEMTGTVKDVDIEKAKLKVSVDMFGRSTPVELEFDQAEKL